MVTFEAWEASLTTKVAEQNGELVEARKKDKTDVDALKKELGEV